MNPYALALLAQRQKYPTLGGGIGLETMVEVVLVDARSPEEAKGIGHDRVRFDFPPDEGWGNYFVAIEDANCRLVPKAQWSR